MTRSQLFALSSLCVVVLALNSVGQTEPPTSPAPPANTEPSSDLQFVGPLPPPSTKLEAFAVQKGVLVIKGYTKVGEIVGEDGSVLRISAIDMGDAAAPAKLHGLVVQVREARRGGRQAISYIDEEEIDPLIAAVEALAKLSANTARLTDFEGSYRTHGDLEIININNDGVRTAGIRSTQVLAPSGQIIWASAYFRLGRLAEIEQQLSAAKETIEKSKSPK